VVLAATIGLLALAPADAAQAVGAAPPRVAADRQEIAPARQIAPVFRPAADLEARGTARPATRVRAEALPGGIGANVQLSPITSTDRFTSASVAIDPNDATGKHLAAVSNFTTSQGGYETYASADGGATWTAQTLFANPGPIAFAGEPGVAYDTAGIGGNHVFYTTTGFDQDLNSQLEVTRRNSDGTFTSARLDTFTFEPRRPMIATDPRSGNGGVYVVYDDSPPAAGTGEPLMVAFSQDATNYATTQVWNSGGEFAPWPVVAADGTVYVVWDDVCGGSPSTVPTLTVCPRPHGQILLSRSTNAGATWSSTPTVVSGTTSGAGAILPNYGTECTSGCPTRPVSASPQIAVDRSGGARNGTLYVVFADGADMRLGASTVPSHSRMHIFMTESRDNGATWSARQQIDTGNPNDAWEPSVAVDQSNGNVVVAWYDRRDDGSNHLYRTYFAESLSDSGGVAQFSAQLPVGDTQSDPQLDCNGSGDYMQIAAANGTAHPVWTDSRSGLPAIFTSAIDETAAATSSSTPGTGFSALRPAAGSGWIGLPGGASDIGVGANCAAWIIGENAITGGGQTWVWGGPGQGWLPVNGGGVRISVQASGLPRVVNNTGAIFRLSPDGTWQQPPGGGIDIGSGADFSLWLIGLDGQIGGNGVWVFNGSGWNFANGGGVRIAVGPDGSPWIVNNGGQIWHRVQGVGWVNIPGGARDIGVGADGSVWIIGLNAITGGWQTWRYNGRGWDPIAGGGVAISVGPDGMPWVVNNAGQIFERV